MSERAIIFDVGKVLLHWDLHELYDPMFGGREATEAFLAETALLEWNVRFDAGLPFEEGIAQLVERFPHHATALEAFHTRWLETVPHAIHGTVDIVERLKRAGVPLYAITNFAADKWEIARERYEFLGTSFIDVIVSGQEGIVKPEAEIFHRLLSRNGLSADRCIFIDDSAANITAASALGFDALHFSTPETLEIDLHERGLLARENAA